MSIQSQINRISKNIQDSLAVIASAGIEIPDGANSDNLPELIALLIPTGPDVATMLISYSGDMIDAGVVTMSDGEYRLLTLTSSGTLTLEGEVDGEVWMCGGGVNGSSGSYTTSTGPLGGHGGAGAYTATGKLTLPRNTTAVVGAGNGGVSSFGDIQTNACSGQNGGTGAGSGGRQTSAGTGDGLTKHPFGDTTYFPDPHCAGGAGGLATVGMTDTLGGNGGTNGGNGLASGSGIGGAKGGGDGGNRSGHPVGYDATFYGSGAGGGMCIMVMPGNGTTNDGGAGYQGVIYVRIPVKQ